MSIILVGILLMNTELSEAEYEKHDDYKPQTHDYYIFTSIDADIDEEKTGIPPDMFTPSTIAAREGDKVRVHFYNMESTDTQEHHTFTINDRAYKIHRDLNAGENAVIEFTASKSGVFEYICTYHQPTMKGTLVVLPS
ncbi:MAG: cupredoxin domain-containing protein [Candidatus Nitrosotenuis sp.]